MTDRCIKCSTGDAAVCTECAVELSELRELIEEWRDKPYAVSEVHRKCADELEQTLEDMGARR